MVRAAAHGARAKLPGDQNNFRRGQSKNSRVKRRFRSLHRANRATKKPLRLTNSPFGELACSVLSGAGAPARGQSWLPSSLLTVAPPFPEGKETRLGHCAA